MDSSQKDLFGESRGIEIRDEIAARTMNKYQETEWSRRAKEKIEEWIEKGYVFTSDELQAHCGEPPHPNAMGAVFLHFANAGRIEKIGQRHSIRVEARGRYIQEWRKARAVVD